MRTPGPATLASIALHAGLGALLFVSWPEERLELEPVEAIRVSVISEQTVAAAAPDNPSEELIVEDGASAPPEPVETLPTPEPAPTPPPTPRAAEKKAVTPPRTPPPRTQPPRPPAPQPKREEPSLDLDRLSERPREGDRRRRAPTGDAGAGQAPRALGRADISALGRQISVNCTPGVMQAGSIQVQVSVRLDAGGRLVGSPRLIGQRGDAAYRAMSDSVLRGIRGAVPFDMPAGYEEQTITFAFNSATACR